FRLVAAAPDLLLAALWIGMALRRQGQREDAIALVPNVGGEGGEVGRRLGVEPSPAGYQLSQRIAAPGHPHVLAMMEPQGGPHHGGPASPHGCKIPAGVRAHLRLTVVED